MKNILRIAALVLVIALTLSLAACKSGPEYSNELVQGKLEEIVNIIQSNRHLHTDDYIASMSEDEFEPVYEAISQVVKGETDIKYTIVSETTETDDDGNEFYNLEFKVEANGKSVNLIVVYGEGENILYSVNLK